MRRKKISFQNLVNRVSPYPLSMQFDIFQWMLKTGWEYDRFFETLYGVSGSTSAFFNEEYGFFSSSPTRLQQELKAAFVRIIVSDDVTAGVKQWRKNERVYLDSYRILQLPLSRVNYLKVLELFRFVERPLTTQLNQFYPQAREIRSIRLSPNRDGWAAIMSYGFELSSWNYKLTETRTSFAEAVLNALIRIKELTAQVENREVENSQKHVRTSPSRWSTNRPTEPGYYWIYTVPCWESDPIIACVEVYVVNREDAVEIGFAIPRSGYECEDELSVERTTHWMGPLPEPTVPTSEEK